jgi:hypothetical protein
MTHLEADTVSSARDENPAAITAVLFERLGRAFTEKVLENGRDDRVQVLDEHKQPEILAECPHNFKL